MNDAPLITRLDGIGELIESVSNRDGDGRHPRLAEEQVIMEDRQLLGLERSRPILATGHQAEFWHPGILAKFILMDILSSRVETSMFHLVADQDTNGFERIEYPATADGWLTTSTWRLTDREDRVPIAAVGPFQPRRIPDHPQPATGSIAEGLQAIRSSLESHENAGTCARQIAASTGDLMRRWAGPMPVVMATDLAETRMLDSLLQKMIDDPTGCVRCYNDAVGSTAGDIRPLRGTGNDPELPLWLLDHGVRRPVTLSMLQARDECTRFHPRAVVLDVLMRGGLCDGYIVGTGGSRYATTSDHWIRTWLGVELSRPVVVSANVTAELQPPGDVAMDAIDHWRSAWHDPSATGAGPSAEKTEWVHRIHQSPRNSSQRRELFHRMHQWIREGRKRDSMRLDGLREQAGHDRKTRIAMEIATRRTWPFPLVPAERLDELAARLREAVSGQPDSVEASASGSGQ
ncbi:MAG: hypothetical protein CMJ32_00490 [Phycisphaerae bacterium]|nr:hypothetical protein [Phycisphaerae bacterium]